MNLTVKESLEKINITAKILSNEPLKEHTSLKCGGAADFLILPENLSDVRKIVLFAKQHSIPITFLGKGTNVLVADNGVRGITLLTSNLHKLTLYDTSIMVECGTDMDSFIITAVDNGFQGVEMFYGLPGTIGGSIFGNAGCFGSEISENLDWVDVITQNGDLVRIKAEDAEFSYRSSIFSKTPDFIGQMHFSFKNFAPPKELRQKCDYYRLRRERKGHYSSPSAGSIFKKPDLSKGHPCFGLSAGELIEKAGLKGFSVHGAGIADFHANFIINPEQKASAADVLQLIMIVQKKVKDKFGINLECEVRCLGGGDYEQYF